MKNMKIADSLLTLSRTRAASALLIAAVVAYFGLSASPAFAKTYPVGPGSANIGDTNEHDLCINGLDPATCKDGVVVTRDDPITGDRVEKWTVEITNTSKDTWKDFHVRLIWKESAFGGAYLSSGSRNEPSGHCAEAARESGARLPETQAGPTMIGTGVPVTATVRS